jgi:predicted acyl esterase
VDEPGIEFRAPKWRKLAPALKTFSFDEEQTSSSTGDDAHAAESDPVFRQVQGDFCYTTSDKDPGNGVAQYTSKKIEHRFVMAGIPTVELDLETTATDYWISARLFDEAPDGSLTLVNRGVCRVNTTANPKVDCNDFDLFGNSWLFKKDHRVVLELSQSYQPFLRKDNFPSTITYTRAAIEIPKAKFARRHDFRF